MKMIQFTKLMGCHFLLVLLPCGCSQKEPGHKTEGTSDHEVKPGVTFQAKKGLRVSPPTAKFIGLEVAEVEERKIAAAFRFSAQVYQGANEPRFASTRPMVASTALASGIVGASEALALREGQVVRVEVGKGERLSGRVLGLNRPLAKGNHVEVSLAVEDKEGQLQPGNFVTVEVATGSEKSVVSVPHAALLQTAEGNFVYTVSGEHFVRAPVKLGVVNHEFAEVTDGLYAGDQIVVKPVMTLWLAELQSIRGGKACSDD